MKPIIPGWHGMSASVWVCVCVRVCMRMRESLHKTAQAHCKVYNFCRRMLYWECARFHYIYILYQYCASCSTFQTVFMCACMYIYVPSVFLLSAVHNLVTITWDYTAFWWLHTAFQTQMYSVLFISLKILASVYQLFFLKKKKTLKEDTIPNGFCKLQAQPVHLFYQTYCFLRCLFQLMPNEL